MDCHFGLLFPTVACGILPRFPLEATKVKLNDCNKSTQSHLSSLKLSQKLREGELISFRAGLFTFNGNIEVCPKHRHFLGIFWRPKAGCAFPEHLGRCRPDRPINLEMCRNIYFEKGVVLPVGAGICKKCRGVYYNTFPAIDVECQNIEPHDHVFEENNNTTNYHLRTLPAVKYATEDLIDNVSCDSSQENQNLSSSQISQESNWSATSNAQGVLKEGLHSMNSALDLLGKGTISPIKFQLKTPLEHVKDSTVRYLKRKANEAVHSVLEHIAPGQSSQLLHLLARETSIINVPTTSTDLTNLIANLYMEADNNTLKCQLLSMISSPDMHTKENLQSLIPGLSKWKIDQSRSHIATCGAGVPQQTQGSFYRNRMDPEKLEHALDFILDPNFVQICNLKFDNGETVSIPEVVRTSCHSSLVQMYKTYCKESVFTPLADSTLYKILSTCSAAKRTNLSGLDNMAADGTSACDSLLKTIEDLSDHGVVKDKIMELKSGIKSLKLYLKSEYSRNIDMASTIPDHCMKFALSSSSDVLLQEKCDHQHEALCEKCGLMEEMEHQIKTAISSVQDFETASDIKLSVDFDISKVKQWKSHILRTKNQNECRYHLMETLESHQMIIVMDWAMKFLPLLFREKQSDFYGQKGLNWHVSVAIFRSSDGALKHNTFTHLLNGCKQDWYAVASILEHTLHTIKAQKPEVEEVFLRSDNAGCYHCGCLWLALDGIGERTGIRILRYDYSEPQAGKSVCDSKIAHMRCKMKMHVSSGGNITTAEDMQAAIMSGVSGCQCAVVSVDTTKQTMFQHKLKGVNSISNLKFEENNIIYWLSFNIGIGRKIMRSDVLRQEQEETGLIIHSNFDKLPDNKHGDIRSCRPTTVNDGDQENRNEDADVTQELPNENVVEDIVEGPAKLFLCPEQGCIKMYQTHSNLERHVYLDRHVYESNPQTSTYDQVRKKWAETCYINLEVSQVGVSTLRRSTEGESVENDMTMMTADQNVGWALKKDRKVTRFSTRVKSYLSDVFQAGNISGKKVNPSDISKLMKCSRNEDGERRFCREECLTTSQINSYFSRLALLNRRDGVHNRQRIELMEDEDLQSVVAAIEDEELRETLHAHLG